MTPPRLAMAAVLAAIVALGGCTAEDAATLPPLEASAVADIYADELAALGVRLTDRGGLVDEEHEPNPDGTHLALYVAPTGTRDHAEYVDGLVEVTALFARDVFDRWPDLESFDVCQEAVPPQGSDSAAALTQVNLTRDAAATVDWGTVDLAELMAVVQDHRNSHVLVFDDELRATARAALNR